MVTHVTDSEDKYALTAFSRPRQNKTALFRKHYQIKSNFKKIIKPNDCKQKLNLTPANSFEAVNSRFFCPDPITPDFDLKFSSSPSKPKSFGRWVRKKGEKSQYLSFEGKRLNGYEAFTQSLHDVESRRSRVTAETEIKADSRKTAFSKSQLGFYGVPDQIIAAYEKRGVSSLYAWQVECLALEGVLGGANLVYSAPTSGGKTLVAEILMLRRIILFQKKCIFVLPFVSLVEEKAKDLKKKLAPLGYIVKSIHSSNSVSTDEDVDVMVCTIEKANLLVNKLMEEGSLEKRYGVVVVDELHIIGDEGRGFTLELLLTKLITVSQNIQIIGLSATMPNINDLAKWLNSKLYVCKFRPVPLEEFVKIKNTIYYKNGEKFRSLTKQAQKLCFNSSVDIENIYELCDVVKTKKSVLIFCPTKEWTKSTARMLSSKINEDKSVIRDQKTMADREMVREKLIQLPIEICPVLNVSILAGVAYHHAGMTLEEREIIENAFRKRTIDILTATSTLSAGVNLPAYRVIFRSPYIGPNFLTTSKYRQMSGRAGRAGIDDKGESIIVASVLEKTKVFELINSEMKPLESRLNFENDGVCRIILEAVASKVARTKPDIDRFLKSTFLYNTQQQNPPIKAALRFLTEKMFVEKTKSFASATERPRRRSLLDTPTSMLRKEDRKAKKEILQSIWEEKRARPMESVYFATQLGNATFFSGLSPDDAIFVKNQISRARKGLVLKSSLHLCYLITPTHDLSIEPNWSFFSQIYGSLSPAFRETAERIGISETFLSRAAYAPPKYQSRAPEPHLHRRFFLALLLYELVSERPVGDISRRFGVERGKIQALQNAAASFARMAALFCRRLNWTAAACLLAHFCERVGSGAHGELVPLLRIAGLRPFRARALFDAGLREARQVAEAPEGEIRAALARCKAFAVAEADKRWRDRAVREEARAIKKGAAEVVAEEIRRAERDVGTGRFFR